jgi:hypothetical protein
MALLLCAWPMKETSVQSRGAGKPTFAANLSMYNGRKED